MFRRRARSSIMRRSVFIALAASSALLQAADARAADAAESADDELLGLWAAEILYTPAIIGDVVVSHTKEGWRAALGKAEAKGETARGKMRFVFSGNIGEFRCSPPADGEKLLRGYWLRPPGTSEHR